MSKPVNILKSESIEEFEALASNFRSEFAPVTETERLLVDMMVQHEWLMRRALRMQETLDATSSGTPIDAKRLKLVARYYKAHERGFAQAKRQLEMMRKAAAKAAASHQRHWEQLLRKMPPASKYVN